MTATETTQAEQTCRITLVYPGMPDRIIKLFPAQHAAEKIDMGKRPGFERWEGIKRLMYQYAPRGEAVPDPAPTHSDPMDLKAPTLQENQIPVVRMEGNGYLKAPKIDERPKHATPLDRGKETEERVDSLAKQIEGLQTVVVALADKLNSKPVVEAEQDPAPKRRGRPAKKKEE